VQEALTNVRRHAGSGAQATITVRQDAGRLTVEVADDGPGTSGPAGEGNGLPGMRARAAALGGDLTAGPAAGGGFVVTAVLPTTHEGDDR
jgi:signal transduction histidine kinase